jgi:hypothetical protein
VTHRARALLTACLVLAVAAVACGKKGNPLPPLRPVPARIADLAVVRTAGQVELRFTVPSANLDGTTPVAVDRVDIYRLVAGPDQPPVPAGQVAANPDNLLTSLPVRRPTPAGEPPPATPTSAMVPAPGESAVFVDRTEAIEADDQAAALHYVAVPVAGTGRGRSGPPTPVAIVSLAPLPEAPRNLALTHDATTVRATWEPAAAGQAFRAYRLPDDRTAAPVLLTPEPLTAPELEIPVEFARETCVVVQSLRVAGAVTTAGAQSAPVCLTPVDRYPPPAPAGVRVVQEGQGVTIIWTAVEAADLAGYVVLRGTGAEAELTPLMRDPVRETTYRDTTAQPGGTYAYAVYAIDAAPVPNASPLSERQTITVR